MTIDPEKSYQATLKTSAGDIVVELNAKATPQTVNNFVFLAREKFYDNTIFHRTIKGFMIQGGDPRGDGTGNPGYKFADEPFTGEYTRGTLAMANSGPDTNGSQFFIMHADTALPKNYVIFGKVISGLEAVDKIATAPTKPSGEGSSPVTPVTIQSVEVAEE
ncbi:MAG: peptidylprolyl isomerase [Candidatus Moranbacteria bacterium RIFCSPHIGHO2_01_FULL_55_24]|nr:MAG: peptidylprolyl isomerase [Candidatus Moranbacteria bacterium RIFCSPHIGHO2_01_FULL_55_24]